MQHGSWGSITWMSGFAGQCRNYNATDYISFLAFGFKNEFLTFALSHMYILLELLDVELISNILYSLIMSRLDVSSMNQEVINLTAI